MRIATLGLAALVALIGTMFLALALVNPPPPFTPPYHRVTQSEYAYQHFVLLPKVLAYEMGPALMYRTYAEISVGLFILAGLVVASSLDWSWLSRRLNRLRLASPKETGPFFGAVFGAGLLTYLLYQGLNVLYTALGGVQNLPDFIKASVWPLIIGPVQQLQPYVDFNPFGVFAFVGFLLASLSLVVWRLDRGLWNSIEEAACWFCAPLVAFPTLSFAFTNFHVESDHITYFLGSPIPFPNSSSYAPVYLFSNWSVGLVALYLFCRVSIPWTARALGRRRERPRLLAKRQDVAHPRVLLPLWGDRPSDFHGENSTL